MKQHAGCVRELQEKFKCRSADLCRWIIRSIPLLSSCAWCYDPFLLANVTLMRERGGATAVERFPFGLSQRRATLRELFINLKRCPFWYVSNVSNDTPRPLLTTIRTFGRVFAPFKCQIDPYASCQQQKKSRNESWKRAQQYFDRRAGQI